MTEEAFDFAPRIARGVQFLNHFQPDWVGRVDLERLDMTDGRYCVIGQLWDGESNPNGWVVAMDDGHDLEDLQDMGFTMTREEDVILWDREDYEDEWFKLEEAWRHEILRLRSLEAA